MMSDLNAPALGQLDLRHDELLNMFQGGREGCNLKVDGWVKQAQGLNCAEG